MLIPNEQENRIKRDDRIVFNKSVFTISGIVPPGRPEAKWSVQLEGYGKPDPRLFKCFNPPKGSSFVKDDVYEWTWCIDGVIVIDDAGTPIPFGEYEVFQFFSILSGW
jgi:hypothetical protein